MGWEYYFKHHNYSKDLFQYQPLEEKFPSFEEIFILLKHRHSTEATAQLSELEQNQSKVNDFSC